MPEHIFRLFRGLGLRVDVSAAVVHDRLVKVDIDGISFEVSEQVAQALGCDQERVTALLATAAEAEQTSLGAAQNEKARARTAEAEVERLREQLRAAMSQSEASLTRLEEQLASERAVRAREQKDATARSEAEFAVRWATGPRGRA